MHTTRRVAALVGALALGGLSAPLAAAPSTAAPGPASATTLQVTKVAGTGVEVARGTKVKVAFTVKNRTGLRQPRTKVWLFLVGDEARTYRLDDTTTRPMSPGANARVRTTRLAPSRTVAGTYAVRACLTPRPEGPCSTSKQTVKVADADLVADPAGPLDLGSVAAGGTSDPVEVTVTNRGHARTRAIAATLAGPDATDFAVDTGTCGPWLAPAASCTLEVALAPAAGGPDGARTADLRVASSRRDSTTVALVGEVATPADFEIVPGSHDYGTAGVGSSSSFTYELTNNTDTDATLGGGELGDYTSFDFDYVEGQNTCIDFIIPAHGSCTFSVAFIPTAEGPAQTTATFYGDGFEATTVLSGTGTPGVPTAARRGAGSYLAG